MLKINVERPGGNYPIFVGADLLSKATDIFNFYKFKGKILLVTSAELEKRYRGYIHACLKPYSGQVYIKTFTNPHSYQNLNTISEIISYLLKNNFNREAAIVSFGGKSVQDIGGFSAAIFRNGIAHISIPTSLRAQLQSTIVSKAWLNHHDQNNVLGVEIQPVFAWIDIKFLESLSKYDLALGVVEALRVAIIWEAALFDFIEANLSEIYRLDTKSILFLVHKVCSIKSDILSKYRARTSAAKYLNFGEVVKNVLLKNQSEWGIRPSEANFLGPFLETILANRMGYLANSDYQRIEKLFLSLGIKVAQSKINFEKLYHDLNQMNDHYDKFAFPQKIGEAILVNRRIS